MKNLYRNKIWILTKLFQYEGKSTSLQLWINIIKLDGAIQSERRKLDKTLKNVVTLITIKNWGRLLKILIQKSIWRKFKICIKNTIYKILQVSEQWYVDSLMKAKNEDMVKSDSMHIDKKISEKKTKNLPQKT